MLNRKDYLLRQLQQLIDAIVQLFTSIQMEEKKYDPEELDRLYQKYFSQNKSFFINNDISRIATVLSKDTTPENAAAKMEVLAELLYGEGQILSDEQMLNKAIQLYEMAINKSGVYDFNKLQRLQEMKA